MPVLGSQPSYAGVSNGGGSRLAFGKLDRIRIEPSMRSCPVAVGLSARSKVTLSVNKASAVTGHPQQVCIAWEVSKT